MSTGNVPREITSLAILFVQSIPLAGGSYGGLSGHDSIWRSMCSLVDQSVGFLLLYGLINLSWFPNSSRFALDRVNFIHSTRGGPSHSSTSVNFRARYSDIASMVTRSGKFEHIWSGDELVNSQDVEAHLPDTKIAPNGSHWMFPYLLGHQPYVEMEDSRSARIAQGRGHNNANVESEAVAMITLSRRSLIRTTALAVARFGILIGSATVITLFHIFIVAFLFDDLLTKTFLILADVGRWLLVIGQMSSVMTYSLDYKGVCTWASPPSRKRHSAYGTKWTKDEQEACKREVLRYMGRFYHARAVFHICDYLWPRVASRWPLWKDNWGHDLFSTFKCFDGDLFKDDHRSTVLSLCVGAREPGPASNDWTRLYAIDFKLPTAMVQLCFQNRLYAGFTQRMWNFWVLLPFCICSVINPFLAVFRGGGPKTSAVIIMGIIQIIIAFLNYKDIDHWSINCKFEVDPTDVTYWNSSNTSSQGTRHTDPQTSGASTSTSAHQGSSSGTGRVRIGPAAPGPSTAGNSNNV